MAAPFRRLSRHRIPSNPDTKRRTETAREAAPGFAGALDGTPDKIDTSSEQARRGLDGAPQGSMGVSGAPAGAWEGLGGVPGCR